MSYTDNSSPESAITDSNHQPINSNGVTEHRPAEPQTGQQTTEPTDRPITWELVPEPPMWEHGGFRAPTEFLTGSAGTGKTTELQRRRAADPEGVTLAATTGIAAVNLGPEVTTIHSLLKFFNYESLFQASTTPFLERRIHALAKDGMRELVIDEISMLSGGMLDLLYPSFNSAAQDTCHELKLTLCGDFCQLPPIPDRDSHGQVIPETAKYAFEAYCWPRFAENTTRLTKNWRQDNEDYIKTLQAARRGEGAGVLAHLEKLGVRFQRTLDNTFEGTTLCATNDQVDLYNRRRLLQLPGGGRSMVVESTRWASGNEPSEWKNIPTVFAFKPGAYVMILANDRSAGYVNGDCGTILRPTANQIVVRLKRNGKEVEIGKIIRKRTTRKEPSGVRPEDIITIQTEGHYDELVRENNGEPPKQVVMVQNPHAMWITGWVRYYPLRLAYATTVHKSQGLSLDAIQLDLSDNFLAQPAMMYVALSRCRTPEGLVLVGTPEQLVAKTQVDARVLEWL